MRMIKRLSPDVQNPFSSGVESEHPQYGRVEDEMIFISLVFVLVPKKAYLIW